MEKNKEILEAAKKTNPLWEWGKSIVIAIILALLIKTFIFEPTMVKGTSMENTLHEGDRLIVDKMGMKFKELVRGDIVIMKYDSKDNYIKRIVGLPGETVQIIDGKVYINREVLKEDYIKGDYTNTYTGFEWKLGDREYFLMGDNRLPGKSKDSREFGPVDLDRIIGVAKFRFYPFGDSFGTID